MRSLILLICFCLTAFFNTISIADNPEPLPVNQAFQFTATARDSQTVLAQWKIAPGYYLYRDRFHFKVIKPKDVRLAQPLWPTSISRTSPEIGRYEVYEGKLVIPLPMINPPKTTVLLRVHYQGCAEKGYCYPPTTKLIQVDMAGNYGVPVKPLAIDVPTTPIQATPTQEKGILHLLQGASVWAMILGFLGLGILISFTPCVLPMIPILSGIIVGQKHITTARAFGLSVAYVLGMAITYAIVGIIFGYVGGSIQSMLQQPWIIAAFSLVFVLLALSLFGFYKIEMPQALRSRVAAASEKQRGGHYLGVFIMGVLSTLILSPCATPALVAVLGYIGQTGNAALGGIALFVIGIGMGTPLLILGAAGGKFLPKAGQWMNAVEYSMGILLLAVATWMLQRIIPGPIALALWSALAIGTAIYMGAFSSAQSKTQWFFKLLGIALFSYGIVMAVGASIGNSNPLAPLNLKALRSGQAQIKKLPFIRVKSVADVKAQIEKATRAGKPVMLDFYADWCISCKEMDHYTFGNPKVQQALAHFVLLRADVTANDATDKTLERYYKVVAPPTILFFNKHGQEIYTARIIGEMPAEKFMRHLTKLKSQ